MVSLDGKTIGRVAIEEIVEAREPSRRRSCTGGIGYVGIECEEIKEESIKQSEEPESMREEKCRKSEFIGDFVDNEI